MIGQEPSTFPLLPSSSQTQRHSSIHSFVVNVDFSDSPFVVVVDVAVVFVVDVFTIGRARAGSGSGSKTLANILRLPRDIRT